jgi:hypothetical protein
MAETDNSPEAVRRRLLRQLISLAERMPNGLLTRLVADAQFYYDWNLRKRRARGSARIQQQKALVQKLEDRQRKAINREGGSYVK